MRPCRRRNVSAKPSAGKVRDDSRLVTRQSVTTQPNPAWAAHSSTVSPSARPAPRTQQEPGWLPVADRECAGRPGRPERRGHLGGGGGRVLVPRRQQRAGEPVPGVALREQRTGGRDIAGFERPDTGARHRPHTTCRRFIRHPSFRAVSGMAFVISTDRLPRCSAAGPVTLPSCWATRQPPRRMPMLLNFNGLSWPNVSVATLVPAAPVPVPASAFA
jgi:hypothetical protein